MTKHEMYLDMLLALKDADSKKMKNLRRERRRLKWAAVRAWWREWVRWPMDEANSSDNSSIC